MLNDMPLFQFSHKNERGWKESIYVLAPSMQSAVTVFESANPDITDYDISRKNCLIYKPQNNG